MSQGDDTACQQDLKTKSKFITVSLWRHAHCCGLTRFLSADLQASDTLNYIYSSGQCRGQCSPLDCQVVSARIGARAPGAGGKGAQGQCRHSVAASETGSSSQPYSYSCCHPPGCPLCLLGLNPWVPGGPHQGCKCWWCTWDRVQRDWNWGYSPSCQALTFILRCLDTSCIQLCFH